MGPRPVTPLLRVLVGWLLAGALLSVLLLPSANAMEAESARTELARVIAQYRAEGAAAALPAFERLMEEYRTAADRAAEAEAARYVGECHWRLGQLGAAGDQLDRALSLARQVGDRRLEGRVLNVLGLLAWDLGEYDRALADLDAAHAIATEIGDARLAASTRNNRGLVKDELGDYRGSLEDYQASLAGFIRAGDRRGQGDALGNIGGVHLLLGQYALALQHYRRALAVSESLSSKPAMTIDHGNLALSLLGLGRSEAALEHFDQALALARETGMVQEEAYWQRGKANALISQGQYGSGLQLYRAALAAYQASGARGLLLAAQHDLARLMMTLGDLVAAEQGFEQALLLAREVGQERAVTENLVALGDLDFRRQRLAESEALYRQALERAVAAGERQYQAVALLRLSRVDRARGRYAESAGHAGRALRIAKRIDARPQLAEAWFALAEAARGQSAFDEAMSAYQAAEQAAGADGDPDLLWQVHHGRALGLEQAGDAEAAVVELEAAVRIIESVRERLREDRYRAGWIEDKYQVYIDLARLQLELGRTRAAFLTAERLRARSFMAQLDRRPPLRAGGDEAEREAELRERIRQLQRALSAEQQRAAPERRQAALAIFSTELMQAERAFQAYLDDRGGNETSRPAVGFPGLEAVQAALGPGDALLEYIVGDRELAVFVVRPEGLAAVTRALGPNELGARIDLLRELIQQPGGQGWRKPAAALSAVLLEPARSAGLLQGVEHLYVVPHGMLNYLPFALLPQGSAGGRLLVDSFTLSYLPTAAALTRAPTNSGGERSLLALAPSRSRLRYAPREAASVAAMFGSRARLLLGGEATESAFKRAAGDYRLLHFATHGVFNRQNPLLSGLELEADERDDGLLEVHEILGLSLDAELVTLSACRTGLGSGWFNDVPAGDDFVGLTRAFLMAGSRSVLASLWEVDDRSTVHLMEGFYRRLEEQGAGVGRAEALAGIQRRLRESEEFNHPFYWAPFVLVGPGTAQVTDQI